MSMIARGAAVGEAQGMNAAELQIIVLAPGASAQAAALERPARAPGGALLQRALSRATAVAGHAVTAVLGAQEIGRAHV